MIKKKDFIEFVIDTYNANNFYTATEEIIKDINKNYDIYEYFFLQNNIENKEDLHKNIVLIGEFLYEREKEIFEGGIDMSRVKLSGYVDGHRDYINFEKDINNIEDLITGIKEFEKACKDLIAEFWDLKINIYNEQGKIAYSFRLQ